METEARPPGERPPPPEPEEEISIRVDGAPLGLSPFVRQMLYSVIVAMLRNLKGMDDPGHIEISLRVKKERSSPQS